MQIWHLQKLDSIEATTNLFLLFAAPALSGQSPTQTGHQCNSPLTLSSWYCYCRRTKYAPISALKCSDFDIFALETMVKYFRAQRRNQGKTNFASEVEKRQLQGSAQALAGSLHAVALLALRGQDGLFSFGKWPSVCIDQ